jgi:hypothetical protein
VGGEKPAAAHRGVLIGAHLIWLSALVVGAIGMVSDAFRHRRRTRTDAA